MHQGRGNTNAQTVEGTTGLLDGESSRLSGRRSAELGVALMGLGILVLCTIGTVSDTVPISLFGWVIVISGLAEVVQAYRTRKTAGFFLHLVPGVAGMPIGLLIGAHPQAGSLPWMLLFSSYFTVVGVFRIASAFRLKYPNWQWTVCDGAATLLLGTILWAAWPWFPAWLPGSAVAVSLILRGWSFLMFAIGLRGMGLRFEPRANSEGHEIPRTQSPGDPYGVQAPNR